LTSLSLVAVLFVAALAIDSGNMMSVRRRARHCSDAAALAGCIELAKLKAQGTTPDIASIRNAVNLSASNNDYTDGTNCTVTVNWPPTSGNFQDSDSVEVLLTFNYANMVVGGSNTLTVRSVATSSGSASPSTPLLLLDASASKSFWVNSGRFTLNNSAVHVNSSSSTAAVVEGSSSSIANATVRVNGGASGAFSPAAATGFSPKPDPFALVPVPSTSGLTTYSTSTYTPNASGNITLNPGYYPNGLYCINGGNVTMNPGLYYIANGNFWINTSGTVTANGVTIYHHGPGSSAKLKQTYNLTCGIVLCPSNGTYNFTPPTSGPYAGISFFQGPTCTAQAFYDLWGTGSINCGIQYLPNSTLRCWTKSTGTVNCNELVAENFKLTGSHEIYGTSQNGGFSKLNWNATRASNRPATNVVLAE
jgi:Flp pilus assembly protein TadG